MTLSSQFDDFVELLRAQGRLIRKQELGEGYAVYEFFRPMFLPSSASVWRVSVVYVATLTEGPIGRVHQEFLEFSYQTNVILKIMLANQAAEPGLQNYLQELGISYVCVPQFQGASQRERAFQELSDTAFRGLDQSEIEGLLSSAEQPPRDPSAESRSVSLSVANRECVESILDALRLLRYHLELPKSAGGEYATTSTDWGRSFLALSESFGGKICVFIYPNVRNVIGGARRVRELLTRLETPLEPSGPLRVALQEALRSVALLNLTLLYGAEASPALGRLLDSLRGLSDAGCVALLLNGLDSLPPDEQIQCINNAILLDRSAPQLADTLLSGARSPIKSVAVYCIGALGYVRPPGAIEVLSELQDSRHTRVRDAAKHVLEKLSSPASEATSSGQSIAFDEIKAAKATILQGEPLLKVYSRAARNSYFSGPNSTTIHLSLMDVDGDQCVAVTSHRDGSRDMAVGKRPGLFSYIAGCLTGEIKPSPEHHVGMGEAAIMDADGKVTRINLESDKEDEHG